MLFMELLVCIKKDFPSVAFIFSFVFARKFITDFWHSSISVFCAQYIKKGNTECQGKEGKPRKLTGSLQYSTVISHGAISQSWFLVFPWIIVGNGWHCSVYCPQNQGDKRRRSKDGSCSLVCQRAFSHLEAHNLGPFFPQIIFYYSQIPCFPNFSQITVNYLIFCV